MNRISLSPAERSFRSRLAQLIHDHWLLRGTLSPRSRKCGKATFHCASGELHASLYLVQSHDGKPRPRKVSAFEMLSTLHSRWDDPR